MNDYIAELTLDLDCRNTLPAVRAGQYDKGRKCLIHITANDQVYSVSGCTAVMRGVRQDRTFFLESCTVNNSGDIEVTLNESILAVRGFAYAKIVVSDNVHDYSTQVFLLDIDSALEGGTNDIVSGSVMSDIINRLIQQEQRQIPTKTSDLTNDSGFLTQNQDILGKMNLAAEITTTEQLAALPLGQMFEYDGDYYQKQSSTASFRSQYRFAEHGDVPTKTSDLTNDSGFLTQHQDVSGKMDRPLTSLAGDDTSGVALEQIFKYLNEYYIKGSSATPVGAQFKIENARYKVTSLDSDSTDSEYPSAKCVYDMIGDVESVLASLL